MFAPPPQLNLLVIRAKDIELAKSFYSALGLLFGKEKHGNGSLHYVSCVNSMVFEIYPLSENSIPTKGVRIGFEIDCIDEYIPDLIKLGGEVLKEPYNSENARHAVLKDIDGHIIELRCGNNLESK